jgi:hypothetical protein
MSTSKTLKVESINLLLFHKSNNSPLYFNDTYAVKAGFFFIFLTPPNPKVYNSTSFNKGSLNNPGLGISVNYAIQKSNNTMHRI